MNGRLLAAFLLCAVTTGCIIKTGGGGGAGGGGGTIVQPRPGNVTFTWSFGGKTCAETPGVSTVVITIPGQTLANGGAYPCLSNNYPGIVLNDFQPGSYTFTVEGRSNINTNLFTGSGTFIIDGDVRVTIDLTPTGGPNSYAYLTWTFPANGTSMTPNCAQAGVTQILASIDDVPATSIPCGQGFGTNPGVQTPYIAAGTHTIDLSAADATGYVYYRFRGTLQTFAGNPVAVTYGLQWAVGGAAVKWTLLNGTNVQTCATAGVSQVSINFADSQGNLVYGSAGDVVNCTQPNAIYSFLKPGSYKVLIGASGTGGSVWQSSSATPVFVTVTAGQFVDGASAVNVNVNRTQ